LYIVPASSIPAGRDLSDCYTNGVVANY
jgi:hypothetical protein